MTAADRWRQSLDAWSIPESILSQAAESPWIHPPELFDVPETIFESPSRERAIEALGVESSVLDVGCGGGAATFALTPEIRRATGVDVQLDMLQMFSRNGARFGVDIETIEGHWPEVAPRSPHCDVVLAHHVAYNVPDIVPFIRALNVHARHRVVLELPAAHPLTNMTAAWMHFWGLERPTGPSPLDLVEVICELGLTPHVEEWCGLSRAESTLEQTARFMRIRLCLAPDREAEVRDFFDGLAPVVERPLVTLWWDGESVSD